MYKNTNENVQYVSLDLLSHSSLKLYCYVSTDDLQVKPVTLSVLKVYKRGCLIDTLPIVRRLWR